MYKTFVFSFWILLVNACSPEKQTTETDTKIQQTKRQNIKSTSSDEELENTKQSEKETITSKEMLKNLHLESLYMGLEELKEKMKKGEKVKLVCFGNSITNGYRVGTYGKVENPYPETLEKIWQKEYNNPNIQVINEGHNGWRIDQAFAQLQNLVISKQPDLVSIMFGINDAYANYSLAKYEQYLKQIIAKLKAQNIKVLLLSPTPINRPENEKVQAYCEVMQKIAKEEKIAFFNVHQAVSERKQTKSVKFKQLLPDDIHFGDDYYAWIAEIIAEEWRK